MVTKQNNNSGFALLMTLIVVGVVLSVGLSILDLSIKQINLSTNAKESETSFHAANAGMECARTIRRADNTSMETGAVINPSCFGVSANNITPVDVTTGVSGVGPVRRYDYEFSWGTDPTCTKITTLVMFADLPPSPGITITNAGIKNVIPGYPGTASKTCEAGAQCTVIAVRGYNQSCANYAGFGVTEREVLLEF